MRAARRHAALQSLDEPAEIPWQSTHHEDWDDWDECEPRPGAAEIWEPLDPDDEEYAEPEPGDFWTDEDDGECDD